MGDFIRIDTEIRSKFHAGFPRGQDPDIFVIHGSAGPNPYVWVRDAERLKNPRIDLYKKGIALWHYTINDDGEVIEMIDPGNFTYHCHAGKDEVRTIGVELENPDNKSPFKDAQYNSLFNLIDYLLGRFGLTEIISHNKMKERYRGKGKVCPGDGFEWGRIGRFLSDNKLSYLISNERFYDIGSKGVVV